jgi:predicted nucleic acid-binding protein
MNERFFPDANIFVYAFGRGSPAKAKRSVSLIKDAVTSGK